MAINIETKDLVLRETVLEDVETFEKWERLPEVTEFFSIRDGQTREECFEKFFADKADPGKIQLSIFLKEGNRLIGRIVIGDIEPEWKCELWRIYIADTALRGKGYGKQAALAVMKYCFEDLQMQRLYLDYYTGNPAEHLYRSLGFTYEGLLRQNCRKNGILYDVNLMSILRDEYEAQYGNKGDRG